MLPFTKVGQFWFPVFYLQLYKSRFPVPLWAFSAQVLPIILFSVKKGDVHAVHVGKCQEEEAGVS